MPEIWVPRQNQIWFCLFQYVKKPLFFTTLPIMKDVDQRKEKRFKIKGGIAMTPNGVCQIINIGKGGLSFKCFQEVAFPHEWTMDIYDETDLSLQELKVKKVWEKILSVQGVHTDSQVETGVAFTNPSSSLEAQLQAHLLRLMEKKNI